MSLRGHDVVDLDVSFIEVAIMDVVIIFQEP